MITELYKKRVGDDPTAEKLFNQHRQNYPELTDVKLERVLRAENISIEDTRKLVPFFASPILELVSENTLLNHEQGPIVEVCYQRGVTDPEMNSTFRAADALGVRNLLWARFSTRYQFCGVDETIAQQIVSRFLCNAEVETIIKPGEAWTTLIPQGQTGQVEYLNVAKMSLQELREMSNTRRLLMDDAQLLKLQQFFQVDEPRQARDGEVEMTAAAWGDHCKHTTLLALRQMQQIQESTFSIDHPLVVSAFDDNSGVMKFYDGWALNVKGETHISPSAVATYGGIMTKHGGVIRDILETGQGAKPFAGTTIMGIANPRMDWKDLPAGALHPQVILQESIRGTKDYTNPMGIPMAFSGYLYHPGNIKCFALGHSVGILPEKRAQKGEPQPGDFVVLIGAKTGHDGLHGATVSSGMMTHETAEVDGTHVQIGMPIEERVIMEVVPVLRDNDCIRAGTDCGAAGLSSALGEMGSNTGIWANLAWVPLKCQGMKPWEIFLSESQERCVKAVPAEKLSQALAILKAYEVPATVIGVFTNTKRCQIVYKNLDNQEWIKYPTTEMFGDIVVDLPYTFLSQECPLPTITVEEPRGQPEFYCPATPSNQSEWINLLSRHLGHFNIANQSAAANQYDQTVQGATVMRYMGGKDGRMPDELSAYTPILGEPYTAGIANAVNQFYGDIDPAGLGRHVMAQAMTKLVAAGFNPEEIVCNVNLYTPRVVDFPVHAWKLIQLIEHGYAPAAKELRMPIISGKDSCSGTFKKKDGTFIHAPLTLDVLALGRMPHYSRLIQKPFTTPGDELILFHPGLQQLGLGGTVFLDRFGNRGDELPSVDLKKLRYGLMRYHHFALTYKQKLIHSRSAIAEGGLIRRLFEMSFGSGFGCNINLTTSNLLEMLFGELSGSILFAINPEEWLKMKENLGGEWTDIGYVTSENSITVSNIGETLFTVPMPTLEQQWSKTFSEVAL